MAQAATVGILRVLLSANTAEFEAAMASASASLNGWTKSLGSIGQQATQLGTSLTAAITVPLVGVGVAAVKTGMEFEAVMNSIEGVLRPTEAQMEQVRQTAMKMGADTVFSASDAAEAILELGKAGFDTATAMESVDEVLQLAAASGFTMAEAAEMSARTLNAFGLEASDLAHVNDVLAQAVNSTSLNLQDLQVAFGYVGPIAQGFGLSIEQVSAALGIMRDNGIAAETTGRALREGLDRLINPTKAVKEVMAELGIETFMSGGKLMNLSEIVGVLEAKGMTAGQALKLFGNAAGPGMNALVSEGKGALDGLTVSMQNSEGAAKNMADAMMKGLPGAFESLKGSIDTLLLSLSKALEPALILILGLLDNLADFIGGTVVPAFTALPVPVQAFGLALTAAAAALGPFLFLVGQALNTLSTLTKVFGEGGIGAKALASAWELLAGPLGVLIRLLPSMATLIAALTNPITLVIAAIGALTLVWIKWGDDIIRIVRSVLDTLDSVFGTSFRQLFDSVGNILSDVGETISNVASIVKSLLIIAFYDLKAAASELWNSFTTGFGVVDSLKIAFHQLTGVSFDLVIPAIKAIGVALVSLVPFLRETIIAIDWLASHTPGWAKSTGDTAAVLSAMAESAKRAAGATNETADAARKAANDTAFWDAEQRKFDASLKAGTASTTTHTGAVKGLTTANKEAEEASKKAAQELEKQTQALERMGIVTESSVNAKLKEYTALENLAIKAGADKNAVLAAMLPKLEDLANKAAASGVNVDALTAAMQRSKAAADALTASYIALAPRLIPEELKQLPGEMQKIDAAGVLNDHTNKMLEQSYQDLGITSRAELNRIADEAEAAYLFIKNSGKATTEELKAAWERMTEAQIAAGRRVPSVWETEIVPRLKDAFNNILGSFTDHLSRMIVGLEGFKEGFKGIWESIKQTFASVLSGMLQSWIGNFLQNMFTSGQSMSGQTVSTMGGIFDGGFKSIISNIGGIMKGGFSSILSALSGMLTSWIGVAMLAIGGLVALFSGAFRGGEEGTQVNPARDQFLSQFGGSGTGPGSGFYELGVQLEAAVGAAQAEALHAALRQADTMAEFNAAVSAINSALGSGGGGYAAPTYTPPASSGSTTPSWVDMEAPEEDMGALERLARGMAAGGFGTVSRPTLFLAGEAGPEQYAFSGANKAFSGSGNVTVQFMGPVFAEEEYIQTTVVDNILTALRTNRGSALTRLQSVAEIG